VKALIETIVATAKYTIPLVAVAFAVCCLPEIIKAQLELLESREVKYLGALVVATQVPKVNR
jgi:hypothetical protein